MLSLINILFALLAFLAMVNAQLKASFTYYGGCTSSTPSCGSISSGL
jgi:hypothetical protein